MRKFVKRLLFVASLTPASSSVLELRGNGNANATIVFGQDGRQCTISYEDGSLVSDCPIRSPETDRQDVAMLRAELLDVKTHLGLLPPTSPPPSVPPSPPPSPYPPPPPSPAPLSPMNLLGDKASSMVAYFPMEALRCAPYEAVCAHVLQPPCRANFAGSLTPLSLSAVASRAEFRTASA